MKAHDSNISKKGFSSLVVQLGQLYNPLLPETIHVPLTAA